MLDAGTEVPVFHSTKGTNGWHEQQR